MPPDERGSPLPRALLWAGPLLSAGYGLGQRVHRAFTRAQRAPLPAICIGNLTAGGTGKTPATIFLAAELCRLGRFPAVLMRGYKAQGADEAAEVERALKAWNVPVVLNSNRLAGALEAQRRGCDTVVLDDGFQHWALRRDLDIVLVDATAPFGAPNADEGHLLPYGYLREKPTALARAGVVIVTRSDCVPPERARALSERLRGFAPHALHLGARHEATELRTVGPANAEVFAPQSLSGKRILALCGIGNPAGFRRTLERLSANVVEFIALDDHHDYTRDELLQSQNRARTANADSIVVTAKDSGKIAALLTEAPGIPILELGVRFVVEDADALWAKVAECIGARN